MFMNLRCKCWWFTSFTNSGFTKLVSRNLRRRPLFAAAIIRGSAAIVRVAIIRSLATIVRGANRLLSSGVVRSLRGDGDIVWMTLGHTSSSNTHKLSRL